MSPKKEKEKGKGKEKIIYQSLRDAFVDYVVGMGVHMLLQKKKRDHPDRVAFFHRKRKTQETDSNPSKRVKEEGEGSSSSRSPQHEADENVELPMEFKEKIQELNGCDVKFVLQKKLFKSDINKNEGRLSIPRKKIANEFLIESEMSKLDERDEKNRIVGMDVLVLDPSLSECNIRFKKWTMSRVSVYYLTGTTWNNTVQNNDLKVDDTLQIWSFRIDSKLCFALVKL